MNREKELAKNTAILSVGKICTQLVSFFLLPLYTAILSTSEYGTVDLLISYSSLLLPIITMEIGQALFRYLIDVRSKKNETEKIISTSILFTCLQVLISLSVLAIAQYFIKNSYMPYFMLMLAACTFSSVMLQMTRGIGDSLGYAIGSFITASVQVVCNVIFLVVMAMGPNGMLLASFVGNASCTVLLFVKNKIFKYFDFKKFDLKVLKEMLRYSAPLIPNQLSWWTINASDKTIVAFFLGTASNGILAVVHKFPSVYIQFNNIFSISWTESAALHIHEDDAEEFFTEIVDMVFRLFLCLCLGIVVCMPFVINWLVDSSYYDAYYQIPIYMVASLCNVVVSLYGVIYVANKKSKDIALTSLFAAIINAGSHLIMINFIGLYAASISSLLGYGTMAVYRYFHSRKYITVKIDRSLLIAAVIMTAIVFLTYYTESTVLHVVAFVFVVLGAIYLNKNFIGIIFKSLKQLMDKLHK